MSEKDPDQMTQQEFEQQEKDDFLKSFEGDDVPERGEPEPGPTSQESELESELGGEAAEPEPEPEPDNTGEAEPTSEEGGGEGGGEEAPESELERFKRENPALADELVREVSGQVEQSLSGRLRNMDGHIGGMKSKITALEEQLQSQMSAAKEAAGDKGAETPSNQQIAEAAQSGEKLKALKEDFPEFAEALEEAVQGLSSKMPQFDPDALSSSIEQTRSDLESKMDREREIMKLDRDFPDWEQTIQSDQYLNWLYNQPAEIQQLTESDRAEDALKVLQKFQTDTASQSQSSAQSRQNEQRLEQSVAPTDGRSVQRQRQKTEHEEFTEAFNNG